VTERQQFADGQRSDEHAVAEIEVDANENEDDVRRPAGQESDHGRQRHLGDVESRRKWS